MLKQLKMDLKLYKEDYIGFPVLLSCFFLVGFGFMCLIMFTVNNDGSWVTMGTFGAAFSLILCSVLTFCQYYQQFMLALSMGRTRNAFLFSYAVRSLLGLALEYALMLVLYRVELAVGSRIFVQPLEVDPTFLMDWRFFIPVLLGTVILSMFLGSLYSYFGKKALAPMYFIWVGGAFLGSRLSWVWNLLPGAVWAGLGIGAAVAMVITIIVLGKKQMVK